MADLASWLANDAPHDSVSNLFNAFCRQVVLSGVPVWRASLGLEGLHPEVSGWQHIWMQKSLTLEATDRATAPTSQSYLTSPTRAVDETNAPFRRLLAIPSPDMPLLESLRLDGATDYIMYPLPFLDRTRTAVISFATLQPGGFSQEALGSLCREVGRLSPYLERHVLRHITIELLDTYVGPKAGRRIIEGRVERGAFEFIEAAILFADLRGFTHLSEHSPIPKVLDHLNAWFGSIGDVLEANGGEILKFIGDAVLAIFPTSADGNREQACHKALTAAQEISRRSEADNVRRASLGRPAVLHRMSLHVGEVAYGNVGAARRLDFTVIGPAVNRAGRLLELAKRLEREVVVSQALASEINEPLADLGKFRLRGVPQRQRVFTFLEP
jgi:adenylate cyclase